MDVAAEVEARIQKVQVRTKCSDKGCPMLPVRQGLCLHHWRTAQHPEYFRTSVDSGLNRAGIPVAGHYLGQME